MKKQLPLILALLIFCSVLFLFGSCETRNPESTSDSIYTNQEDTLQTKENEYISFIKHCAIVNACKLYCNDITYEELLSDKYFDNCSWSCIQGYGNMEGLNCVTFKHSGSKSGSNMLAEIIFICDDKCSQYTILDIRNQDGTSVRESVKKLFGYNEKEQNAWLINRIEICAFDWVDASLISEKVDRRYVRNRNGEAAYLSLSNKDSDTSQNIGEWNFSEFSPIPFTMNEFSNYYRDTSWYDNGIFSSYISLKYPNDTWEYRGSFDCNMSSNPYGYTGFQIYSHQCEEAQRVYTYLVPISPATPPEVYLFDEVSQTMKLVFVNGEVFD